MRIGSLLSHFRHLHPNCIPHVSELSSLKVSVMSEQSLTANRNSSFEYRSLEYFSMLSRMRLLLFFWRRVGSLRILRCCRSLETSSIKSADKNALYVLNAFSCTVSNKQLVACYVTVSSRWLNCFKRHIVQITPIIRCTTLHRLGYRLVRDHNSQFPLLDISCYTTFPRRNHWVALAILLKRSITRHFNYSTFQRPHPSHVTSALLSTSQNLALHEIIPGLHHLTSLLV